LANLAGFLAFNSPEKPTLALQIKIGIKEMTQPKKKQDDRLLKQLNRIERKQQEMLRRMIQSDPLFKVI
jgi:hypothetical protein